MNDFDTYFPEDREDPKYSTARKLIRLENEIERLTMYLEQNRLVREGSPVDNAINIIEEALSTIASLQNPPPTAELEALFKHHMPYTHGPGAHCPTCGMSLTTSVWNPGDNVKFAPADDEA